MIYKYNKFFERNSIDPIERELSSSNNWGKCEYSGNKGFVYKYNKEFSFYVLNRTDRDSTVKSNYCLYLVNNIFDDFNFIAKR